MTQGQWKALMGDNRTCMANESKGNYPVECVTWEDAQIFIQKLNAKGEGLYRLPTEAEWEYACRATSTTLFNFGDGHYAFAGGYVPDGIGSLDDFAWYLGNANEISHEVATKKPNYWGLYDMHGNVEEWTQDWFGEYKSGAQTDPTGPVSGKERVFRGGSWTGDAVELRSSRRSSFEPNDATYNLGFRLVREFTRE